MENKPQEQGKTNSSIKLLKIFTDVISMKGRPVYHIDATTPVPQDSLNLWRQRGYEPATIGIAHVKFDGSDKEYKYPAYFWSE